MRRAPLPLVVGFALFVGAIAGLVAASVARPAIPTWAPTAARAAPRAGGTDTVTLDARDEARWVYYDFATARTLALPDTAGWDVAARRFHLIAADAAANLGPIPFDSVAPTPPDTAFARTTFARDTSNAALARWYRYGMLTHLLTPRGDVHLVRTRSGALVMVEVLGYYCPGVQPGCLTMRYRRVR